MICLVLFVLALVPAWARADKLAIDWQVCLGGTGVEGTAGGSSRIVQPTADHGFIVGISSSSVDGDVTDDRGKLDFWIVKLDDAGTVQWKRSFGGSENDILYSVIQTADGGFLAVGSTASVDGDLANTACEGDPAQAVRTVAERDEDGWALKLDAHGDPVWKRVFGTNSTDHNADVLQAASQYDDGTYVVAGRTHSNLSGQLPAPTKPPAGGSDVWAMRLDADGHLLRQNVSGGQGDDVPNALHRTRAGAIVLAGYTSSDFAAGPPYPNKGFSSEKFDLLVLEMSPTLETSWFKVLAGNALDDATSIIESSHGDYVVAGYTYSTEGGLQSDRKHRGIDNSDAVVFTIDPASRAISWLSLLGGTEGERAQSVVEDADGNYVVAARTNSKDGDVTPLRCHLGEEGWIVKVKARDGRLMWERLLGDVNSDGAWSVAPVPGGYVVAGTTRSDHTADAFCQSGDVTGLHGTQDDLWVVRLVEKSSGRGSR